MTTEGGSVDSGPQFFDSVGEAFDAAPASEEADVSEVEGEEPSADEGQAKPAVAKEEPAEGDDDAGESDEPAEDKPEPKADDEDAKKDDEGKKPFLKIKANGEDHELSEEQAKILAQKGLAADEKFKEAATLRKQTEALVKQLKDDPIAVLQHPSIGVDFRKIAEEYLYGVYEFESKPEMERKAIEAERELERYRAEEAKRREQEEQAKLQRATQFYVEKFKKEIGAEVDGSGIPDTMWATQRAVHYLKEALGKGVKATAKDVMEFVKQDYQTFRTRSVENMTPEQIIAFLGEENLAKVKKHQLQQRRQSMPPSTKPTISGSVNRRSNGQFKGYQSSTNEIFG